MVLVQCLEVWQYALHLETEQGLLLVDQQLERDAHDRLPTVEQEEIPDREEEPERELVYKKRHEPLRCEVRHIDALLFEVRGEAGAEAPQQLRKLHERTLHAWEAREVERSQIEALGLHQHEERVEGFLLLHLREQRRADEAHPLAIADTGIVHREGVQHVEQLPLPDAVRAKEEGVAGESAR